MSCLEYSLLLLLLLLSCATKSVFTTHTQTDPWTHQELSVGGDGHAQDAGRVTHVRLLRPLPTSADDVQLPVALQAPCGYKQTNKQTR